ncbi:hypothetical protein EZV73_13850 [Acidaminobacter sp. JC074]|uniref:hypothetical protein n=1 Tax=Acidaminobacter sp. JC074 TaxID=2530199 RepID=UPI001F110029|nr:hypothetical protein [Acidaminobacter sp. JC074]MCH4888672.1 hypothetical protein [Acidaminobacter sp. JC074]
MGKYSKEDYEFERNKQEILALTQRKPVEDDSKSVWAYELEEYRKHQKKEKFMMFGAICGIISLLYIIVSTALQYL